MKINLEDFCKVVDREEVYKKILKLMEHHLEYVDKAILRCMSVVMCKETLKELLEERKDWEKDAKEHMLIIMDEAKKL